MARRSALPMPEFVSRHIATSHLARFTLYAIMSSGGPSAPRPSTLPSASGNVTAGSELEKAIQSACAIIKDVFRAEYASDDDRFRKNLSLLWFIVRRAISRAGDSNLKGRLRDQSEFRDYVMPGSDREQELIKLVRSMANGQVPWRVLFENGTLPSSL
jgi:hypothetical protein